MFLACFQAVADHWMHVASAYSWSHVPALRVLPSSRSAHAPGYHHLRLPVGTCLNKRPALLAGHCVGGETPADEANRTRKSEVLPYTGPTSSGHCGPNCVARFDPGVSGTLMKGHVPSRMYVAIEAVEQVLIPLRVPLKNGSTC